MNVKCDKKSLIRRLREMTEKKSCSTVTPTLPPAQYQLPAYQCLIIECNKIKEIRIIAFTVCPHISYFVNFLLILNLLRTSRFQKSREKKGYKSGH